MKLISWNVNGLRACLKKGFMEFFRKTDADIYCLQETKMQEGQAELNLNGDIFGNLADRSGQQGASSETASLETAPPKTANPETTPPKTAPPDNYREYWNSAEKKGYSGTAVFTRIPPLSATYGMSIAEHDREGRIITLEYDKFYLVNVYTPNSQRELARLDYRMKWEDAFREYVCGLDKVKPVVICGDLNVAHTEMDIKNAKSNVNNAGFTKEEREKMTLLLEAGFTDFYRHLNPNKSDAYTWWSYMGNARERNVGWRIDYFVGSTRLTETVNDAFILPEIMGSDHCPVGIVVG